VIDPGRPRSGALLDPVDRSSEVLFGLIMALTFTTTFEVATAGRSDVRTMLIGALGCNLAWGLVDGVMFVVTRSVERYRFHSTIRALQAAPESRARQILEHELPDGWGQLLDGQDLERLAGRARAATLPAVPGVTAEDLRGGLAVLLLCFFATLPVALPFLLMGNLYRAARVSDAVGILMLFVIGRRLGRFCGRSPMLVGLIMVAIGVALSAVAIRLGG
jgi:VIT1/CCC1 family predicted Fe2+/Mn2+ transporter